MLCRDTGAMEAIPVGTIRVPRETIELAQQLQPVIDMIRKEGRGEGEITIKVTGGKVRKFFEFAGRWFFGDSKEVIERG